MTGDEMQRAIEFLLKNQASFETHFEETNRHWKTHFEESNRRFEIQTEETNRQWKTRFEESNRRFEIQTEETNRQIAQINHVVESLADTQTAFTQTVIGFASQQNELNASVQKKLAELAQAQQSTEREISDLTRVVNNIINFSSGNGDSPPE